MTMPDPWTLLSAPTIDLLGWTLLHFVWQGALLAAVLAGTLYLLRNHAPRVRYAASGAALLGLLALPVGTGIFLSQNGGPVATQSASTVVAEPAAVSALPRGTGAEPAASGAPSWREQAAAWLQPVVPWLVLAWGVGVIVFAIRLTGGAWRVRRLRETSRPAPSEWRDRLQSLAEQMGLSRTVTLRRSERVESPMVAGWWRPVVLVPAGLLSGLPPQQVEALLLHELAHVRRHDVLVGRLQAVAETLLFFHPATWWVSRQVREAREACCDDLAVRAGTDRTVYARALTALAERAVAGPAAWPPAASDGEVLARIRRLLSPGETASAHAQRLSLAAAVLLLVGVPLGLAACASQQSTQAGQSEERPANRSETADFQVLVEGAGECFRLTCREGCAWSELTFNAATEHGARIVDPYGMGASSAEEVPTDSALANFEIEIKKTDRAKGGHAVHLACTEGCTWDTLRFGEGDDWDQIRQAVTQNGRVSLPETSASDELDEPEMPSSPDEPSADAEQRRVIVIGDDSTGRTIRLGSDGPATIDSLGDRTYVVRQDGRTDTLDLPDLDDVDADVQVDLDLDRLTDLPGPPIDADSFGQVIRRRVNPDSLARVIRGRVDPDSLDRALRTRINPDSIAYVLRRGRYADSLEHYASRRQAYADSLRRHAEQMRARMRRKMPEQLREQARRLRDQAQRLEERARDLEPSPSPEAHGDTSERSDASVRELGPSDRGTRYEVTTESGRRDTMVVRPSGQILHRDDPSPGGTATATKQTGAQDEATSPWAPLLLRARTGDTYRVRARALKVLADSRYARWESTQRLFRERALDTTATDLERWKALTGLVRDGGPAAVRAMRAVEDHAENPELRNLASMSLDIVSER